MKIAAAFSQFVLKLQYDAAPKRADSACGGLHMTQAGGSTVLARDGVFYPLVAILILLALVLRWLALPFRSHDMQDFLLRWFDDGKFDRLVGQQFQIELDQGSDLAVRPDPLDESEPAG